MQKNTLLVLAIAAFFAMGYWVRTQQEPKPVIVSSVEIVRDDSTYTDTTKQIPLKADSIVYKWNDRWLPGEPLPPEYIDVDTPGIIAAYLAEVYGSHTLKDDTAAFISVDYMVSENEIKWFSNLKYQDRSPTHITTTTVLPPAINKTNLFMIGAQIRGNTTSMDLGLFGGLAKKRMIYKGGYYFNSKTAEIGIGVTF